MGDGTETPRSLCPGTENSRDSRDCPVPIPDWDQAPIRETQVQKYALIWTVPKESLNVKPCQLLAKIPFEVFMLWDFP